MVYRKICLINKILSQIFEENIYELFLNKYCYEYYLILKHFYSNAKLVIEKNEYHCAALIDDLVYDVTGIRNKDDFYIAEKRDLDFVSDFFCKFEETEKNKIRQILFN